MNRTQFEHIIRAASRISGDREIVVIGSQAIHAQPGTLPAIAVVSMEADVYPRRHPERAEEIDAAMGELSAFHQTFGYYAHGVSPETAILPSGWQDRLIAFANSNTGGAVGLCLDAHDLALSKYAAGREKDRAFNQAMLRHGHVRRQRLLELAVQMPVDAAMQRLLVERIETDDAAIDPLRRIAP